MSIRRNCHAFIAATLTTGGDARITIQPGSTSNIYGAAPYPRALLAYAASTANDISEDAFQHLADFVADWNPGAELSEDAYAMLLERLRWRIRNAYGLSDDIDVIFAPSGTDLEYVALQLARTGFGVPITNFLLGADEVGSGCLLSAAGRFFANETAIHGRIQKGDVVEGLAATEIIDIPIRNTDGVPCDSETVRIALDEAIRKARSAGRTPLAHVVHGSKTGLVLPNLAGISQLRASHSGRLALVVDACQSRIEPETIRTYLDHELIVLMTGSKFMGGPPFSGFALVPKAYASRAPIAPGLAQIFRRAEWPRSWQGLEALRVESNPGLLLRLEAAVFELERFMETRSDDRLRVFGAFNTAIDRLADNLGVGLVGAGTSGLHTATLATLDLSTLPGQPDFNYAQRLHRILAARGIRLGQPVKCLRLPDGRWAGTLRISLSMPMIVSLAKADDAALRARFDEDFGRITEIIRAAMQPAAA